MSNIQKTKKLGPRLTEKQKAFVHFLVQGLPRFNMTEAALEAGYSVNGVRKQASRVWSYPHVKAYYSQLSVQYWKQQQMGSEEALARVAEIARTDIQDIIKDVDTKLIKVGEVEGEPIYERQYVVTFHPWDQINGRQIKGLSFDKQGNPVLALHDSLAALDKILKAHKIYNDNSQQSAWNAILEFVARKNAVSAVDAEYTEMED